MIDNKEIISKLDANKLFEDPAIVKFKTELYCDSTSKFYINKLNVSTNILNRNIHDFDTEEMSEFLLKILKDIKIVSYIKFIENLKKYTNYSVINIDSSRVHYIMLPQINLLKESFPDFWHQQLNRIVKCLLLDDQDIIIEKFDNFKKIII